VQDQAISYLASRLEQLMLGFGYEKVETPIIQPAELFLTKAGDQIMHRLFTFERLGRQLALRPEFTALAAHTYVTQHPDDQPVVRWQFNGPIFEETSGDSQRFSIGAELIGMSGAPAEAEIIALAANGAAEQGLKKWRLVIGHVQLMRILLERFHLDTRTQRFILNHLPALPQSGKAHILDQLDRLLLGRSVQETVATETHSELSTQQMLDVLLDATQHGTTMGGRTRQDVARRLLQKHQRASERGQVVAALDFLEAWSTIKASPEAAFRQIEAMVAPDDTESRRILTQWRSVITLLDDYGISESNIEIQPSLARSWDYYTGIVFELWSEDGLHLGGGGRYDELTRLIGGTRAIPAVGFAYYVDQLIEALPNIQPAPRSIVTITATRDSYPTAIRWAQLLRERGYIVTLFETGTVSQQPLFIADENGNLRRYLRLGTREYTTLESLILDLETDLTE
jgi:histidyl-tRNA synthetase